MSVDHDVLGEVLRPVIDTLRVDGFDLELAGGFETVTLRVVAGEAACADCLVPKDVLRSILDRVLSDHSISYDLVYPNDDVMTNGESPPPELDLFGDDMSDNFDQIVSDLIERCPVAKATGGWLLTRHEDVRAVAHDWETFSNSRGIVPWKESVNFRPSAVDPPLHEQFRRPFLKLLAPQAVSKLEPLMRQEARALISRFREEGRCDVAMDFSRQYVGNVFFEGTLGLAGTIAARMLDLIYQWVPPPYDDKNAAAMAEYTRYVDETLRSQLDVPSRSPVVEAILSLEVDGQPASWDEKRYTLEQLIVGGLDTTVNAINSSLLYLSTHPEVLTELVEDRTLIPGAVEELLRRFTPVFLTGRTVTRETELHGQLLKPGEWVMLAFGATPRDPRVFDDPLTVDIHRRSQQHLVFGAGIHRCLGSHLARLEIRVAIEEFVSAIPVFSLDPDAALHWAVGMTREVAGVRLVF